jgi:hypothetical protein
MSRRAFFKILSEYYGNLAFSSATMQGVQWHTADCHRAFQTKLETTFRRDNSKLRSVPPGSMILELIQGSVNKVAPLKLAVRSYTRNINEGTC